MTATTALAVEKESCRLCHQRALEKVLELTPTPLANDFREHAAPQPALPLDLMLCHGCGHVQLGIVVDPEVLYSNYLYSTATFLNPPDWHPVVQSFQRYADELVDRWDPGFAVDIGCNDATLLRAFSRRGCQVLGVDPAKDILGRVLDVPVHTAFFGEREAKRISAARGRAKFITANNVLAHVDDLDDVMAGVKHLLGVGGVFSMQCSYLYDVLEKGYFDTIYHEHLDYHTVGPLIPFFERHGLELFEAQHSDLYGGSVRLFVGHKDEYIVDFSVSAAVAFEDVHRLGDVATYERFRDRIGWAKDRTLEALDKHYRVAGFGAPAKLTTLMHHFGLTPGDIPLVVDDTPAKQGRVTPGLHIPIKKTSALEGYAPDAVLCFAWNCAEAIKQQHPEFTL
jgi:SAM-dependent methyltransferase